MRPPTALLGASLLGAAFLVVAHGARATPAGLPAHVAHRGAAVAAPPASPPASPPAAAGRPAARSAPPSPPPPTGIAGTDVPARHRGLPLAVGAVLAVGVAGAVVRVLAAPGERPGRVA